MGFGRSRRRNLGRDDERKGKARPKLALAGGIVLAIGILLSMYGVNTRNLYIVVGCGLTVTAGILMLLFSLSKRNQIRFVRGIDRTAEAFKEPCHCCKCTNCDRNHNHWTHD
jgi:UDP-N-acetylmuramyl pentapeptide phosphotransferase/UDP-N-acetylglucosamine-1-phosphate transferase